MSTINLRANQRLAHRTELPMALGCTTCPELEDCGGLKTDEPVFNCDALCRCTAEERLSCTVVCRSKSAQYARYRREVGGFKLDTVGRAPRTATAPLPATIPWLDGRGSLAGGMALPAVAVCWQETASRGIPTALHLNARTDFDWFRWRKFLEGRDEIDWVAFEFATGAAGKVRGLWHLNHLLGLAGKIRRPLRLVVRGGLRHLTGLRSAFASVAFVATTPLMKTRKRRRLVLKDGAPRWRRVAYHAGERLDQLFLDNVESYSQLVGG
jgi:hypothetical protein